VAIAAWMGGVAGMDPDEVAAVERQDGPAMGLGEDRDILVGDALSTIACFLRRQDVMAQRAQPLDHGPGKVLVGVKPHAASFSWISWSTTPG
jgi:hypothetical protein